MIKTLFSTITQDKKGYNKYNLQFDLNYNMDTIDNYYSYNIKII